jgi:hypothetical protein
MTTFDPTKPVQRRNGAAARIIYTGAAGTYPIIALIGDDGDEKPSSYTEHGRYVFNGQEDPLDLINIPVKHTLWINIYPMDALLRIGVISRDLHPTREAADDADRRGGRIACVEITFEA